MKTMSYDPQLAKECALATANDPNYHRDMVYGYLGRGRGEVGTHFVGFNAEMEPGRVKFGEEVWEFSADQISRAEAFADWCVVELKKSVGA